MLGLGAWASKVWSAILPALYTHVALRTPRKGSPLSTSNRSILRESQRVKGLKSKLSPKELASSFSLRFTGFTSTIYLVDALRDS